MSGFDIEQQKPPPLNPLIHKIGQLCFDAPQEAIKRFDAFNYNGIFTTSTLDDCHPVGPISAIRTEDCIIVNGPEAAATPSAHCQDGAPVFAPVGKPRGSQRNQMVSGQHLVKDTNNERF